MQSEASKTGKLAIFIRTKIAATNNTAITKGASGRVKKMLRDRGSGSRLRRLKFNARLAAKMPFGVRRGFLPVDITVPDTVI